VSQAGHVTSAFKSDSGILQEDLSEHGSSLNAPGNLPREIKFITVLFVQPRMDAALETVRRTEESDIGNLGKYNSLKNNCQGLAKNPPQESTAKKSRAGRSPPGNEN
jgi:hypothetical protein